MNSNVLIAYFSRAGENYRNGKLVTLTVGNTEIAAQKIAVMTGADLFKIDPLHQYSKNYRACTEEAKQELQSNARPGLKQYLDSIDSFNSIVLAYPNWWNTMPMPVWTFLEHYDFSGKVILPLCTHEAVPWQELIRYPQALPTSGAQARACYPGRRSGTGR